MSESFYKKNIDGWVRHQIDVLRKQAAVNKTYYRFLVMAMLFINLTGIVLSFWAIVLMVQFSINNPGTNDLQVILASASAGTIILLFILQFVIIVYRTRMREKIFKSGMDEIQLEVMKYTTLTGEYHKKNKESSLLLEKRTKEIVKKTLQKKRRKKDSIARIIFKALTGGKI